MSKKNSNYYKVLAELPIKRLVEKKGGLDYLSWSNAWDMLKKTHPKAQRKVYECDHTGLNFFTDGKSAYVKVGVLVNEIEHIDYLPVMDYRNKSISTDKLSSMDVNKAIQRATAKAIAMHGLGLSLWTGEDIPSEPKEKTQTTTTPTTLKSIQVGTEEWKKVEKYVKSRKWKDIKEVTDMIGSKYRITATVTAELLKLI